MTGARSMATCMALERWLLLRQCAREDWSLSNCLLYDQGSRQLSVPRDRTPLSCAGDVALRSALSPGLKITMRAEQPLDIDISKTVKPQVIFNKHQKICSHCTAFYPTTTAS